LQAVSSTDRLHPTDFGRVLKRFSGPRNSTNWEPASRKLNTWKVTASSSLLPSLSRNNKVGGEGQSGRRME